MSQKCEHCVKFAGGCSWTDTDPETYLTKFQPVEGWTAEKSEVGYHIIDCPEFVSDGTEHKRINPGALKWDVENFLILARADMTESAITRRMGGMPTSTIRTYKTMLRKAGKL